MSSQRTNVPTQKVENGPVEWLLKHRLEETGTMFRAVWDNYLKFYTVFLTFNIAAMGYVLTRPDQKVVDVPMSPMIRDILGKVFAGENLLVAATSACIALYSLRTAKHSDRLERALLGKSEIPYLLTDIKTIPAALAAYAGWANCIGMLGLVYAWIYLGQN